MWQFEYDVQLADRTETLKYDGSAPTQEEVWSKADAFGTVKSIAWRILVDGKEFRNGDFPREFILPTPEQAIAYLRESWSKALNQKTAS